MTPIRSEMSNKIKSSLFCVNNNYFVCIDGGRYHLISKVQGDALLEETKEDFCNLVSSVESLRERRQDNVKIADGIFATQPMTPERWRQIKQALREFTDPNGSVTFKAWCECNYPDLVIDAHQIWIDRHQFRGSLQ